MKNFFEYIPPFAPDYSGASAVFYSLGALVMICDPGGCSGNVCGYDEPRFYDGSNTIFSAAIRDMDAVFGKDDKIVDKIASAATYGEYPFIALVGTPVVSVIATDLEALCHMIEARTGVACISVDTNGMDYYDVGEMKARKAIAKRFGDTYDLSFETPLSSMPSGECLSRLINDISELSLDARIMIIHEAGIGNVLRDELERNCYSNVTIGTFFRTGKKLLRENDYFFDDEEVFMEEAEKYDCIVGDTMYFKALEKYRGKLITWAHYAVSGDL